MVTRRRLVLALAASAVTVPGASLAQKSNSSVRHIAYMSQGSQADRGVFGDLTQPLWRPGHVTTFQTRCNAVEFAPRAPFRFSDLFLMIAQCSNALPNFTRSHFFALIRRVVPVMPGRAGRAVILRSESRRKIGSEEHDDIG